jgi:phosphoribosyl 1,2-cyclic phosphate phosphodiesterase
VRVTILGCGSSTGVPRVGHLWGACDPNEPKNWRSRCSILVEEGETRILVDTSPDLRMQLLNARVSTLAGVVWTHDHADQTHGIDDLRVLALTQRRRMPCYGDRETLMSVMQKFRYCFEDKRGYPAILDANLVEGPFRIGGVDIVPFEQDHGIIKSLGLRFGDIAYSNDVVRLPESAFEALRGVRIWIVDALHYKPHPTHAHVALALQWIERVKPERAVLTNMNYELDYRTLKAELPPHVEPAFDGMVLEA